MPPLKGHQRLVSLPALYQPPVFLACPTPTASPMSNPAAGAPAGASVLASPPSSPTTHISSLVALLLGQSALAMRWAFHVRPTLRQCPQYRFGLPPSAWGRGCHSLPRDLAGDCRHPSLVSSSLSWLSQEQCCLAHRLPWPLPGLLASLPRIARTSCSN